MTASLEMVLATVVFGIVAMIRAVSPSGHFGDCCQEFLSGFLFIWLLIHLYYYVAREYDFEDLSSENGYFPRVHYQIFEKKITGEFLSCYCYPIKSLNLKTFIM